MSSRRKTVLGIAVLFALALSALSAANASALGTTAQTCVKDAGNGKLFGSHCLETGAKEQEYKHVNITETTSITATNANTASETSAARVTVLRGTLIGVKVAITCSSTHGTGVLENRIEGEMVAHIEGKLTYTGCVVDEPVEKGCKVKEEKITTAELTFTTKGLGMAIRIEPKVAPTFASVTLEGCSIVSLNKTWPVTGSLVAQISGATVTSTEAEITTQNTLKFGGNKAGLDGALTLKGPGALGSGNPITVTTE